jgi:four helix bundle protein
MGKLARFEDLDAWVQARKLVKDIYLATKGSTLSRDYSLKDQIQRAAVSIMSNLAEGFERRNGKEKLHFYNISRASCGEVRSLLYACEDLGYMTPAAAVGLRSQCARTGMLVSGLMRSYSARTANSESVSGPARTPISEPRTPISDLRSPPTK